MLGQCTLNMLYMLYINQSCICTIPIALITIAGLEPDLEKLSPQVLVAISIAVEIAAKLTASTCGVFDLLCKTPQKTPQVVRCGEVHHKVFSQ
jgi:hypothetical protein